MSVYYPQAAVQLIVLWENFDRSETFEQTEEELFGKPYSLPVQAKSVRVEVNDYTEADTFDMVIDYKQFPFDPRTMRSVQVTIWMQDVSPGQEGIKPSRENLIYLGFADEESISFDENNREVRLSGRDYTSLLIDFTRLRIDRLDAAGKVVGSRTAPKLSNPANGFLYKPIDEVFRKLLAENRATRDLLVQTRLNRSPPLVLPADLNQLSNTSYWNIMSTIVARKALILFVEKDTIVIRDARNLYDTEDVVQLVYGRNIKNLEYGRMIGRQRDFNIRIRAPFPNQKGVLVKHLPRDAQSARFKRLFGVKGSKGEFVKQDYKKQMIDVKGNPYFVDGDFIDHNVANIGSEKELIALGEKVYEEISRQQLEGSLTTMEMEFARFTGKTRVQSSISFKDLTFGTAIELVIDQDDLTAIQGLSDKQQREQYLLRKGFPATVASAFATSLGRVKYRFYLVSYSIDLSESGFQIDMGFINFIELPEVQRTVSLTPTLADTIGASLNT